MISLEQSQRSPEYFGYTWEQLLQFFERFDYELYDLFGLRYAEAADLELCSVWDFVAFPREHRGKDTAFAAVQTSMRDSGVRLP